MRRASFMHTKDQMRIGAACARDSVDGYSCAGKDVTRRLNWRWAKRGMFLLAVERCQGIKPGQGVEVFGVVEILDVRREPLDLCTDSDARREGFPELRAEAFVEMFCTHMGCRRDAKVSRVVFHHVDYRRSDAALLALTPHQALDLGVASEQRGALMRAA
jgi:hypothetical protein